MLAQPRGYSTGITCSGLPPARKTRQFFIMPATILKSPRKLEKPVRTVKLLAIGRRRKPAAPPELLPEEIALESAILAAAARDVVQLSR